MTLEAFFSQYPRVAIAFSGGVDSAYLLYAAHRWAKEVHAYYARSVFQPAFELADAQRLAAGLAVPLTVLEVDVLSLAEIRQNPPDRCYHCKNAIFAAITEAAVSDGFEVLCDGTNASDDAGDRPGMRVLRERGVRSPLAECGLVKDEIRRLSREAGLFTWDKPAYACLATRFPTGEALSAEGLAATEAAETFLASLGFRDFRVRCQNGQAKIQVTAAQFPLVLAERPAILKELKKYYHSITLDLEARQ